MAIPDSDRQQWLFDKPKETGYLSPYAACNLRDEKVHRIVCVARCDLANGCTDLKKHETWLRSQRCLLGWGRTGTRQLMLPEQITEENGDPDEEEA